MTKGKRPFHEHFEEYTFCYMEQLFRYAYARLGNLQDAEDLVQETYFKAYRSFDNVRKIESIKSWLLHIMLNSLRDFKRKQARCVPIVAMSELDESLICSADQLSPEDELCRDEVDPELVAALKAMPVEFRTPLLLREVSGAKYDEIAHALNIPIGTVMSRLYRARTMLRNALSSHGGREAISIPVPSHNDKDIRGTHP